MMDKGVADQAEEPMAEEPVEEPMAEDPTVEEPTVEESTDEEHMEKSAVTDPIAEKTNEARTQEDTPQTATSSQSNPRGEHAEMPYGLSTSVPPRASPFTRTSFHDISDTSSSSESISDDEDFKTPFSKMSFEEFESQKG